MSHFRFSTSSNHHHQNETPSSTTLPYNTMGASCTKQTAAIDDFNASWNQSNDGCFNMLHDDVLAHILSYCATFPQHETVRESLQVDQSRIHSIGAQGLPLKFVYQPGTSTMTHELVLVCRRFRDICNSASSMWEEALARSLLTEEWNLEGVLREMGCQHLFPFALPPNSTMEDALPRVQIICSFLSSSDRPLPTPGYYQEMCVARWLYIKLWESATLTLPSVTIRSQYPSLGTPIQLHVIGTADKQVVKKLVSERPRSELDGKQTLSRPYPQFLTTPLASKTHVMQLKRWPVA